MATQALTARLTVDESKLAQHEVSAEGGLYALGVNRFGRHGDATRQSAQIKRLVRERMCPRTCKNGKPQL